MLKTMILSKVKRGDTGDAEIDRVCLGLRTTMGWLADAIERTALQEAGYDSSRSSEAGSSGKGSKNPGGAGGDKGHSRDSDEQEPMPPAKKRVLPS